MSHASMPRPEHPRPQFVREDWINLNGEWSYVFDFGESGMDRGREWFRSTGFDGRITVPFCPESELSGVGHKDFIPAMWYHREIRVPADWGEKRILIHFGAVDYECEVFVDGTSVETHFGGTVSFAFDITRYVEAGKAHHLVVRVKDHTRGDNQPGGKQCPHLKSRGCHYTRTTGIWQTVWLEAVGMEGLKDVQIIPDLDGASLAVIPRYHASRAGLRLQVQARAGDEVVAEAEVPAAGGMPAVLALRTVRPWSLEDPFLYDIDLKVVDADGNVIDAVSSYAGLRKVHIEGNRIFLNNKPVYQRLVLDQGFYPDGIWTAPTDEALKKDIVLSMQAGFNGARLHQKVFEERFLYWADRLGYIVWGESASWGCNYNTIEGARNFISEWREIIVRDRNHPALITWVPWNESRSYMDAKQHRRLQVDTYNICKDLDPTRPVNSASGGLQHVTDIWAAHNYTQDGEALHKELTPDPETGVWRNRPKEEAVYSGQPYVVDEFGGIKWVAREEMVNPENSWGYGDAPKTLDEFYARLEGQVDALLGLDHVSGYCYTQLTDVEQEQNGIYYYDRSEKFDMERIAGIFNRQPARYDLKD